jgi:hypothetical protein
MYVYMWRRALVDQEMDLLSPDSSTEMMVRGIGIMSLNMYITIGVS